MENCRFSGLYEIAQERTGSAGDSAGGGLFRATIILETKLSADQTVHRKDTNLGEKMRNLALEKIVEAQARGGIREKGNSALEASLKEVL